MRTAIIVNKVASNFSAPSFADAGLMISLRFVIISGKGFVLTSHVV